MLPLPLRPDRAGAVAAADDPAALTSGSDHPRCSDDGISKLATSESVLVTLPLERKYQAWD